MFEEIELYSFYLSSPDQGKTVATAKRNKTGRAVGTGAGNPRLTAWF